MRVSRWWQPRTSRTSTAYERVRRQVAAQPIIVGKGPLLDAYTAQSGVTGNTVFVEKGLAQRVGAEGTRSSADVIMTVDIGNLVDLVDRDLTQPVRSPALEAPVPVPLRDADGRWFTLSMRACSTPTRA